MSAIMTMQCSKDWQPKAARLAKLGWKVEPPVFQALENLTEIFPGLGNFAVVFSGAWKNSSRFFQGLENDVAPLRPPTGGRRVTPPQQQETAEWMNGQHD